MPLGGLVKLKLVYLLGFQGALYNCKLETREQRSQRVRENLKKKKDVQENACFKRREVGCHLQVHGERESNTFGVEGGKYAAIEGLRWKCHTGCEGVPGATLEVGLQT